jgi:hypothetical protein
VKLEPAYYRVCVYGGELDGPRHFDTDWEARDYAAEAMFEGAERFETWHCSGDFEVLYDRCDRVEFEMRFSTSPRSRLSPLASV